MKKTKGFLVAAGIVLAIAFIFSCSSDDGGGGGDNSQGGNGSVTYKGQKYRTVKIGEQVWFAENLNYAVGGSRCYDNLDSNCNIYGRLYDWSTAMAFPSSCNSNSCSSQIQFMHKGICPDGWHIPSDAEWRVLIDYAGDYNKLKAKSGWNDNGGTDDYGFSALPGGVGYSVGSFNDVGNFGYWWSASEYDSYYAYYRSMYYYLAYAYWIEINKSILFSVRCLQD